jgi:hypothetical protein
MIEKGELRKECTEDSIRDFAYQQKLPLYVVLLLG